MLKRFTWKEHNCYSIQLKNDLYIIAQLLKKPYVAFYSIQSKNDDFENQNLDLNNTKPLGVCCVLKDFFRKCATKKLNIVPKTNIPLPELFISKDPTQWANSSQIDDKDLIYNLVKIDPEIGSQGIMGNEIIKYNINKKAPEILDNYEITGMNTGYELVRRLILSVENNCWIDPLKEQWLLGKDKYPLKTVAEMWESGVPKYI